MVTRRVETRISGVALAGGQSKRLGRNKAVEKIGGQSLIQRVIERLSQVASETVVVVAEESKAQILDLPPWARVVADLYPGAGSLGGIFTGLSAAKGEYAIVVACDMPFLDVGLLRFMLDIASDYDVVVPVVDGRPEPLHAVYSKRCLGPIESWLRAGEYKIIGFFDEVDVGFIEEEDLRALDPDLLSFFNVNTQRDLEKALALEARSRA